METRTMQPLKLEDFNAQFDSIVRRYRDGGLIAYRDAHYFMNSMRLFAGCFRLGRAFFISNVTERRSAPSTMQNLSRCSWNIWMVQWSMPATVRNTGMLSAKRVNCSITKAASRKSTGWKYLGCRGSRIAPPWETSWKKFSLVSCSEIPNNCSST